MDYLPELEGTLDEPIPRFNVLGVAMISALLMVAPLAAALWVYA